jgi:hypothetical protein
MIGRMNSLIKPRAEYMCMPNNACGAAQDSDRYERQDPAEVVWK